MIADAINSAVADVWAKTWAYLSLSFLDPFWGWLFLAVIAAAAVSAVVWFFGSWLPALRAVGGVIILLIAAALFGYRKGEQEAREHDKKWKKRR